MPRINKEARSNMILFIVSVFLLSWIYTEVAEYFAREKFEAEVRYDLNELNQFRSRGDRFTQDDGIELEERIDNLEQRIEQ